MVSRRRGGHRPFCMRKGKKRTKTNIRHSVMQTAAHQNMESGSTLGSVLQWNSLLDALTTDTARTPGSHLKWIGNTAFLFQRQMWCEGCLIQASCVCAWLLRLFWLLHNIGHYKCSQLNDFKMRQQQQYKKCLASVNTTWTPCQQMEWKPGCCYVWVRCESAIAQIKHTLS